MTLEDIDAVVADWVRGAVMAREAGFAGSARVPDPRGAWVSALAVPLAAYEPPDGRVRRDAPRRE